MAYQPLADKMRPSDFDSICGQHHLFGNTGIIRKMCSSGHLTNMIFFGPPGTGKTSAANILAKMSGMALYKLNATTASTSDIKDIIAETSTFIGENGILLYLDEIQYFNKKQQQSLLEYIEDGRITLIASTTENPYIYVYNAIISRSAVFEFKPLSPKDILPLMNKALDVLNAENATNKVFDDDAAMYIASLAAGDARRALNLLENAFVASDITINKDTVDNLVPNAIGNFDRAGTVHYDMLSALQKSIRGSDPDAAIFYLAKILEGGNIIGACRRLQVIACEDIGLAYPTAASIVRSCVDIAMNIGMPEARLPLSEAAIFLATAPKSNSAYLAYDKALADINAGKGTVVPSHMRPVNNFSGYKYPHDYPNHYVKQQYLPNDISNARYYDYGNNKIEQAAKTYWDLIKSNNK